MNDHPRREVNAGRWRSPIGSTAATASAAATTDGRNGGNPKNVSGINARQLQHDPSDGMPVFQRDVVALPVNDLRRVELPFRQRKCVLVERRRLPYHRAVRQIDLEILGFPRLSFRQVFFSKRLGIDGSDNYGSEPWRWPHGGLKWWLNPLDNVEGLRQVRLRVSHLHECKEGRVTDLVA